jgi:hypothetical protein
MLPKEGDLTTIRIVNELRETLSFTEEEHALLNFQQGDNQLRWNDNAVPDKDVDVGMKAMEVIHKAIKELDNSKKLTPEHIAIIDEFEYTGE